jgi:exodeoxyribonuclease-5
MSLTAHQQEKLDESLAILENGKRLLISGSAGVGKTYLVNELVSRLRTKIPFKKIIVSAPTNKAVAVVKGKVDEYPNLEFATVHSSLKIKKEINYKTGAISFKPYYSERYPPLKNVGLLIIDEASMLNKDLLTYVEEHADANNAIVVFIGDAKQLNPIGELVSPIFASSYPEVELTEIIRQGEGNPIIHLSRNLDDIKTKESKRVKSSMDSQDMGYLFSNDLAQVVETLAVVNGTDELKYLAWTNKEVDLVNTLVRQRIYGTPAKIEVGETLIFNSPYGDGFYTNQEIKVEQADVKEKPFHYPSGKGGGFLKETTFSSIKFKYYSINASFSIEAQEYVDEIIIIHEDSEKEYEKLLKKLKMLAKTRVIDWGDYFKFIEQFANMTYNHAITVHKSQGSTYEQAIVNIKNLNLNRNKSEKQRLLYTAVTRAARLLILYKA